LFSDTGCAENYRAVGQDVRLVKMNFRVERETNFTPVEAPGLLALIKSVTP